jgi:hypothetical protein
MFKTPHLVIEEPNPVFDFELRRIKRLALPNRLWWYGALVQTLPCLAVAVLYGVQLLGVVYAYNNGYSSTPSNYGYLYYSYSHLSQFYNMISVWAAILLLAVGLMVIAGSINYLAVSIHTINQQMNSGHWDMLRLSPLPDEDIYEGKLRTAEIRAWRVMNIEVALRLMLITLIVMVIMLPPNTLVLGQDYFSNSSIGGNLLESLQRDTFYTCLLLVMLTICAVVWVFEPRWRMRTLLAMGLSLSSRVRNISMSSVAALFGLIGFVIGFLFLVFALLVFFNGLSVSLWQRYYNASSGNFDYVSYNNVSKLYQVLFVAGFAAAGYAYYAVIRVLSQRSTLRHAFRSE